MALLVVVDHLGKQEQGRVFLTNLEKQGKGAETEALTGHKATHKSQLTLSAGYVKPNPETHSSDKIMGLNNLR